MLQISHPQRIIIMGTASTILVCITSVNQVQFLYFVSCIIMMLIVIKSFHWPNSIDFLRIRNYLRIGVFFALEYVELEFLDLFLGWQNLFTRRCNQFLIYVLIVLLLLKNLSLLLDDESFLLVIKL